MMKYKAIFSNIVINYIQIGIQGDERKQIEETGAKKNIM